ncbi:MAG: hypothetical protein QNI84_10545 [Henriciella sp.]|nr:hypothetical protein [Henriciella sp.]
MCFSATASFAAAGLTGAVGVAAIVRAPSNRHLPFAAIPIVFAIQQAIEGLVWLRLESGTPLESLPSVFAFIAEALWPLLIPITILLIEPERYRRYILGGLIALGALFFLGFSVFALNGLYVAEIEGDCIQYSVCVQWSPSYSVYPFSSSYEFRLSGLSWLIIPYAMTTIGAVLLSSFRHVRWFGYATGVGLLTASLIERAALVSVWCFFAALSAILILVAIEGERRRLAKL